MQILTPVKPSSFRELNQTHKGSAEATNTEEAEFINMVEQCNTSLEGSARWY